MAALRLEMPGRIPRVEYSAHRHWPLIERVCGIRAGADSSPEEQQRAGSAFVKAWDYGMMWNTLTKKEIFGDKRTSMGHAAFEQQGVDFSDEVSALFEEPEEVFAFDLFAQFGPRDKAALTAGYNADWQRQQRLYPDCVNMTGIYVSLMSGLIDLLGWDTLLTAAGMDPAAFGDFTRRYAAWISQYFEALAACDSPVVMIHDDIVWTSGPFLHPDFYRAFIFPGYKALFRPLHEAGKTLLYTSDGDYTCFFDDIAACGVSGFVLEPMTDMACVAERYGKTHSIVGNADTRVLLLGSRDEIRQEVKRCVDTGRNCPGFIMAVGNHIPANTPVENALWYNECFERLRRR